jgi:hypothetical protein
MAQDLESQIPLAVAALGATFAEALLEVLPSLEDPLKRAVLKAAHTMDDRGKGWEVAADSMRVLSRALVDPALFPKRSS